MRVIAGDYRGRQLKSLKGDATRPTTDRVKESVMSGLYSLLGGFDDLIVLDAFAGSGQLGIEALSRGAKKAYFCEQSRDASRVVESNIRLCKVEPTRFRLLKNDTFKLPQLGFLPEFDLVFLDPPYAIDPTCVTDLVRGLDQASMLAPDAVVVYEYARKRAHEVEEALDALEWDRISARNYGDTAVVVLRRSQS